ncbi:dihydrolipoamide acetyltransferase family protein [Sphingomonas oryzagri]|uniref:Dihydrolipoamide acetyltransferase component of pyruvate dehydrogenase complex n=1 Tax=Sphingomonas oryzagri TaxID=3042314 RepID=A0ABT6N6A3_9SPHN|nr:dihydrolipoamide acetyltransferase family protein [Sphingomonas oryzagri]MDH7640631.1 dihydrolipoamide acetyltransferase family protein [Sphingomonas oryzagri]
MARVNFRLPDIGEGIAEAEIVTWHVKVGDHVEEDQPVADMMTDKATVEMAAPVSGKVIEVAGAVGDQIAIGSTLVVFETEGGEEAAPAPAAKEEPAAQPSPLPEREGSGVGYSQGTAAPAPSEPTPSPSLSGRGEEGRKVLASPAVRQRAKELGVDLAQVHPAAGDRVKHSDLDAFLKYQGGGSAPARSYAAAPIAAGEDEIEEIKVTGLRRRIAENMAEAKRRIPHFAYVDEVDVTAVEALRAAMNETRGERPKLTMLPFLIRAITKAARDFPMVNARFDDEAGVVQRHSAVHLGMATQTDAGLSVPVIRDAQTYDVWGLAGEIVRLADATRRGKAKREELSGSTITLTSLGALGGIVSTPVINRPEVAIVGVNKMVERPVVIDGRIEVRKMMNLSSSFDHRVVDGMDAAKFIQAIRRLIEVPALLFAD